MASSASTCPPRGPPSPDIPTIVHAAMNDRLIGISSACKFRPARLRLCIFASRGQILLQAPPKFLRRGAFEDEVLSTCRHRPPHDPPIPRDRMHHDRDRRDLWVGA